VPEPPVAGARARRLPQARSQRGRPALEQLARVAQARRLPRAQPQRGRPQPVQDPGVVCTSHALKHQLRICMGTCAHACGHQKCVCTTGGAAAITGGATAATGVSGAATAVSGVSGSVAVTGASCSTCSTRARENVACPAAANPGVRCRAGIGGARGKKRRRH
jgi:hypothetical protein